MADEKDARKSPGTEKKLEDKKTEELQPTGDDAGKQENPAEATQQHSRSREQVTADEKVEDKLTSKTYTALHPINRGGAFSHPGDEVKFDDNEGGTLRTLLDAGVVMEGKANSKEVKEAREALARRRAQQMRESGAG